MASTASPALTKSKALPPVIGRDDLPPPPPSPLRAAGGPPPPPPPKSLLDEGRDSSQEISNANDQFSAEPLHSRDAPLPSVESPSFPPRSPAMLQPPSPNASSAEGVRTKKVNPFVDLLETEKTYVDTLSGIIRKVAAAWSRSNLPPPELDMMFRSIEAIFKANRSFLTKLKEIGPNPSSPRAIGDLLMKWIDQLDSPYTKYCSSYLSGFDAWEPVQTNQRLPSIMDAFSASIPPPHAPVWTLDTLLSLPRIRIRYYQKLYGRLLKTSAPGKSTDQKLIEGVGRLENLLTVIEERSRISLPDGTPMVETTDEVVIDTRVNTVDAQEPVPESPTVSVHDRSEGTLQLQEQRDVRASFDSSNRGSSLSSGQRSSRDTAITSEGRTSVTTLPMSMTDLERRLSTERCRDLFTMAARSVRLSMNSPGLPYTRELKLSEDTSIYFTPKSTNVEVIHQQGHVFLLTDLFLICERMNFEDRALREAEAADMWLCYPPLAAKHLRVAPFDNTDIEVTILKKEVMRLHFDSMAKRDSILKEFKSTAEQAASLPPPSKQPVPPVPSLNGLPSSEKAPSARYPSDTPSTSFSPPRSANASPIPSPAASDPSMRRIDSFHTYSSASSRRGSEPRSHSPSIQEGGPPPYSPTNDLASPPPHLSSTPGSRPQDPSFAPGQFIPPPRGESSRGGMPPPGGGPVGLPARPNMRDGPFPGPPSFTPGQIIPPQRSESSRAPPHMGGMPPPRGVMSPPPMNGMNGPPRGMMSPPPMNSMSPPPMHGMGGGPPPMCLVNGPPQRSGSLAAPRPLMGGPGPGAILPGQGPMPGQYGPGQGPNHSQHMPPHPGMPFAYPGRPSSDPSFQAGLRKTPSLHSIGSQHDQYQLSPRSAPPVPNIPNNFLPRRENSYGEQGPSGGHLRPMLPSAALPRISSAAPAFGLDDSPPTSPVDQRPKGPVESSVLASMKCKVFLQQQHAQWKALGSSKLTLYLQRPTMVKQLVVEADNKDKTLLISTIVLTDGVERVGKTGVAIELSDSGARTGIVYMIQLRNEKSAGGLYDMLLSGSDRGGFRG